MSVEEAEFTPPADLGVPFEIQKSNWVVMKFGGTSVASAKSWQIIAGLLEKRCADGLNVLVVHSAIAGVSNALSALLDATESGGGDDIHAQIVARHVEFSESLGLDAEELLADFFEELSQLAAGSKLVREVSPRVRARVMALGELMATTLSSAWLNQQDIKCAWVDARNLLVSQPPRHSSERQAYLSAVCDARADAQFAGKFTGGGSLFLTQGFIASNSNAETVLLGRGGSDTSASYMAARLSASRLEIWSDVPGVFSADPKLVPGARLLTSLHYDEAQEIASTGGSVLHPRCIAPVRRAGIPIYLRCTSRPTLLGTVISPATMDESPVVKAVSIQKGITLFSLEGIAMWQEAGFLADVFQVFARHGVSIDLVSTSESNVTVSVEEVGAEIAPMTMDLLVAELTDLCRVRVLRNCSAISLVGRRIRAILHKIGPALEVFEEERVYLVSQAANDLNLSFVTDEDNGYRIVERLHALLFQRASANKSFGLSWEEFHQTSSASKNVSQQWWRYHSNTVLEAMGERDCAYLYNLAQVREAAGRLTNMASVGAVFYAMKANPNPDILRTLYQAGVNFECVSPGELNRIFELFPDIDVSRILFTPNFAPRAEYEYGFSKGVQVTLDNLYPLRHWPELFEGHDCFVRLDPGQGRGHHEHVKTAGTHAKFGIPLFELEELERLSRRCGCRITGIHAHSGSGILDAGNWPELAGVLSKAAARFPDVRVLDLGGGLGVPERAGDRRLDVQRLDAELGALKEHFPDYELWLEPGRYLVAEAGVLLAKVTQIKGKSEMRFVGVATGMNSLIRPALYGAYHEIVNLTRINEPGVELVTIVGPICESADKLGSDRMLPESQEGDVLLVANTGAYGYSMGSHYNLREPAPEICIDCQ